MSTYTIEVSRYESATDARLGRHVNHDSRNRQYAVAEPGFREVFQLLTPVRHHTYLGVSDQKNVGGCTGWAQADLLGYDLYYNALSAQQRASLGADINGYGLRFYTLATQLDNIPGEMPGQDTGSDGPSAAKAAKQLGWISGYKHAFSAAALMSALQSGPVMVGTDWYNSMFEPDASGNVSVDKSSGLAGGHEYVADEYDPVLDRIGFLNSWGASFGVQGRFYVPRLSFNKLLAAQGDVTVPTPLSVPAPVPTPVPPTPTPVNVDPDVLKAYGFLHDWAQRNGVS